MLRFAIENKIPFAKGLLEPFGEVRYLSPEEFSAAAVKDCDAIVVRTRTKCDAGLLSGSRVRLVATATIGTDHIDLEWCGANGIAVRNAAGCNAPGVAQYVWAALLNLGFDPARHTLGIVGVGHVGSIVADWGKKLGAAILVCDPPRKDAGHKDFDYLPLDTLLREADAVTLHTPLTKTGNYPSFHLIGERELGLLKPGAILINSARGPVADNTAFTHWASMPGNKAVADVWEGEPQIYLPLLHEAVFATPHIAGYSLEGKQRATRMAVEAVGEFFGFKPDTSGLCGDYVAPASFPADAARIITDSYSPAFDTQMLKHNPGAFESLRGNYNYRREPRFS